MGRFDKYVPKPVMQVTGYEGMFDKYVPQQTDAQQGNPQDIRNTLGYRMAQWGVDKEAQGNWVNDKIIGTVNAGAGIAKTVADLARPGGSLSRNIDGFIQGGKDVMTPERQAADALYAFNVQQAKANGEFGVGAMFDHYAHNPSILLEDVAGNALPFMLTGGVANGIGAGARTTQLAVGTLGAASGAGTVRGNIYDNTQGMDDAYLQSVNPEYRALRQSQNEMQAKNQIGTQVLPNLPMIAAGAASGFATGATGLGRVVAGRGGNPMRVALSEFVGEAVDEGGQQFLGNMGTRFNVDPNYSLSNDVALNAAQGALIGAPSGVAAGIGTHLNNRRAQPETGSTKGMFDKYAPQNPQQKAANLSQAIAQAGQVANHIQQQPASTRLEGVPIEQRKRLKYNDPALNEYAAHVEKKMGLPNGILNAIKNHGERSNSWQVSSANARGVMQFIGSTAQQYNLVDAQDPIQSINAAGRYFKDMLKRYNGNVDAAITEYNGGIKQARNVQNGGRPFVKETIDYLDRVKKGLSGSVSGDYSQSPNHTQSLLNESQPQDNLGDDMQSIQDAQDAMEAQAKAMREAQDHMEYAAYQQEKQSKALRGSDTEVEVNGKYEPSEWQIQEADDLGATMDKADNQFRDRSRLASEQQIDDIANNLDHRKLTDSPMMDYGAPTLAQDERTVIGGNGRIAAIKRAYANGKADQYRIHLTENAGRYGFTPEQVQQFNNPVLVRRFKNSVDVQQAAIASNEGGGLTMSALEQSKVDASRLPPLSSFHLGDDGNLNTPANREAIRAFVGAFPKNHQASLLDANGMLSQQGLSRLKNAMLYQAYGDSPTLSRLVESNDIESRNVGNAMMQAAGAVADAKTDMAQGDLHDLDISQDIMQAADILEQIKAEGGTIREYLAQRNLFDEHMTPVSRRVLRFLDKNLRSAKKIRDLVNAYYDAVRAVGSPKQADMLGGDTVPTREQLLDKVINDAEQRTAKPESKNLFEPEYNREATAGHERSVGALADESGQKSETGRGDGASTEQSGEQGLSDSDGLQFSKSSQPNNSFDTTARKYGGQEAYERAKSQGQTELNYRQWVQVRTPEFKAWFGDWENDPDNASKVINPKTGEPLVVYHGTTADIEAFDLSRAGEVGERFADAAFFTSNPEVAAGYAQRLDAEHNRLVGIEEELGSAYGKAVAEQYAATKTTNGELTEDIERQYDDAIAARQARRKSLFTNELPTDGANIIPVFLRSATPVEVDAAGGFFFNTHERAFAEAEKNGSDSVIVRNVVDRSNEFADGVSDVFAVFDPTQIKSATGNSGAFSVQNDDIRFSRSASNQGYLDVAENSFDKTAAQYGGHSAYEQAKSKGETELNYHQWVQVRTPEFKAWFGDWENDPAKASKVLNPKTGEPLVMYHGTRADFNTFDLSAPIANGRGEGEGFYFISDEEIAKKYATRKGSVIAAFLNMRKPFRGFDGLNADEKQTYLATRSDEEAYKKLGIDGFIVGGQYIVRHPNQIKSATDNIGAFSVQNDDIRFSHSADTKAKYEQRIDELFAGDKPRSKGIRQQDEGKNATQKTSVRAVQKAIHDLLMFKDNESVEQQLPNVRVVQSDPSVGSDVQAMYNHKTKQITLIADNIPAGQELSVFLHEVFHKRGRELMGERYAQLKGLIEQWANHSEGSIERQVYDAAKRRADESGETGQRYDDELIAYSIEEAVNRGIEPKRGDLERTGVRGFVARAMQLFNQVLSKVVGKPISLTPRDLVTAAHAAAKLEAKNTGKAISTMESEPQLSKRAKGFENVPEESIAHEEKVYREGRLFNQAGELKAGKAIYDKLGALAKHDYSPLSWLRLVSHKPQVFTNIIKEYTAENTRYQRAAKAIAEASKPYDVLERKLIKQILTNELDQHTVPTEHIVQTVQQIRGLLNQQTDELVAMGMLSKDSAERWRDTYLPRFYDKQAKLFDGVKDAIKEIRSTHAALRMGLDGSHLKGRGIFKSVPKGSESQWQDLGWEIRGQDSKGNPVVWRDYTPEERLHMNENQDGIMSFTAGYLQTQSDLAKARLYQRIAMNEELASKTYRKGWQQIHDKSIADTGLKRFGALSGMYVHPDVYDHMKNEFGFAEQSALLKTWRMALGYWKKTKTVYNPVAHFNNTVSNVSMLWLAGGSPITLVRGCRDLIGKNGYYQEAIDAGLIGEGVDSRGIREMFGGVQNVKERGAVMLFLADKAARWHIGKPLGALKQAAEKAYRVEDEVFKFAVYTQQRDRGLTVSESRAYAEQYFFDYSDVPQGVRVARDSGFVPFASYSSKAIPALLRASLTRPHRMLALVGAAHLMGALSYMSLGDDADEDKERENMPEYRKGMGMFGIPKQIRLPWNDDGKAAFIDIMRITPMGDFADTNNQFGGVSLPNWMMISGPLVGAAQVFLFNQDPFTGDPFKKDYESGWDKKGDYAKWLLSQWLPSSVGVPFSYHTNNVLNGLKSQFEGTAFSDALEYMGYTGRRRNGDPVQLGDSVRGAFGIKTWSFDPEAEAGKSIRYKQYEAREIRTDMRKTMRDQSLTPAQKQDKLEEQRKALSRLFPAQSVE